MTPITLNREQSRAVDRRAVAEYGMSSLVLMENAGRGCVDLLCRCDIRGPVAVCCGHGNNAGDGFVIARHLDLRGHSVRVLLLGEHAKLTGDALANYTILQKCDVPLEFFAAPLDEARFAVALAGADWIVDALLGTGAVGAPRAPFDRALELMNAAPCRRFAVDLPSGLDCDTGLAAPQTFRADHTATFVAPKPGFYAPGAEQYTGAVHVLDIGAPRKLVEEEKRKAESEKPR